MNIAQIIPGLGVHCGGPSRSVLSLCQGLRDFDVDAHIITNDDPTDPLINTSFWIHAIHYKRNLFGYNHAFKQELESFETDLFHVHSVYSYSSTIAMRVAQKRQIPYVVSPRGSLLKSAISISSKQIKTMFNKVILIPDLNRAAAIHATSQEEMDDLFDLGVRRPIILIPNSIRIPEIKAEKKDSIFRVGVCGRINPKKNIDGIIRAWKASNFDHKEAELVIVGGARLEKEQSYLAELHALESDLDIHNIKWTGPQYGQDQLRHFNSFSVLLLGSHSENFGMVVPEALAMGIPVIASFGTPWEILSKSQSGWWIDNSDYSISKTLTNVYDLYLNHRDKLNWMGQNGIQLVTDNYSQDAVAKKWLAAYEWILLGKQMPSFVNIH